MVFRRQRHGQGRASPCLVFTRASERLRLRLPPCLLCLSVAWLPPSTRKIRTWLQWYSSIPGEFIYRMVVHLCLIDGASACRRRSECILHRQYAVFGLRWTPKCRTHRYSRYVHGGMERDPRLRRQGKYCRIIPTLNTKYTCRNLQEPARRKTEKVQLMVLIDKRAYSLVRVSLRGRNSSVISAMR